MLNAATFETISELCSESLHTYSLGTFRVELWNDLSVQFLFHVSGHVFLNKPFKPNLSRKLVALLGCINEIMQFRGRAIGVLGVGFKLMALVARQVYSHVAFDESRLGCLLQA